MTGRLLAWLSSAALLAATAAAASLARADEPPFPGHPPIPPRSQDDPIAPSPPKRSAVMPAPALPTGTIEVEARAPDAAPSSGLPVKLTVLQRSPAIGERRTLLHAVTDPRGVARFATLTADSEHWFVATVEHAGAAYASAPFQLDPAHGSRVIIPIFPSTSDLGSMSLSVHCFVLLSLRDDVIHVDLVLRVLNQGERTWLPAGYRLSLPAGWRAFSVPDPGAAPRFVEVPGGAELVGAMPPGEHEVALSFQLANPAHGFLPWTQRETETIELVAPPRVVHTGVWIERHPGLRLAVDGFAVPRSARAPDGTPGLLVESTWAGPADVPPVVPIRLDGMPLRGGGPFFTIFGSLVLLAWGLAGLTRPTPASRPVLVDVDRARARLLEEIATLERALGAGFIGPQTHATARRALVEALARLEEPTSPPRRARPKSRKGQDRG